MVARFSFSRKLKGWAMDPLDDPMDGVTDTFATEQEEQEGKPHFLVN